MLTGIGLSVAVFLWRSLQLDIDVDAEDDLLTFTPRGVLWFGRAQRLDARCSTRSPRTLQRDGSSSTSPGSAGSTPPAPWCCAPCSTRPGTPAWRPGYGVFPAVTATDRMHPRPADQPIGVSGAR
ncbi:hypothetical protein ACFSVJ_22360 [Prauserella oleivorans]